jgi:Multiubiquitin
MPETDKSLHPFFVDAKRYETAKTALTGGEIKAIANVAPNYQLFLEEEGDRPDKGIGDGEGVGIIERVKHFFAVPPATFGFR